MATLEKGAVAFEIAWSFFLHFFWGGNPWKRESGDFRLLWDHFLFFLGGNPWKKESGDLRLLWDCFFWWHPLEEGVWRFEIALGLLFIYFF